MRAWDHKFVYDQATLKASLEKSGFSDVTSHNANTSFDENLIGLESHGDFICNVDMNDFETLVLEARK